MTNRPDTQLTEYPHIVRAEGLVGGEPIIAGTRIAVRHIVGYYYEAGMSVEEILLNWDYLQPAQVFSALAYYYDHQAEIDQLRHENSYDYWQEHYADRLESEPAEAVS